MNNILQLKSQFYQRKNPNKPGSANLPVGKTVKGEHIVELTKQLKDILNYWEENTEKTLEIPAGALIAGNNEIVVFELKNNEQASITLTDKPIFK